MDISHKVPFAEIYARDEYYFKEPVVGVVGAFMRTCKPYIVVANTLGKALKTLELARAVILTPYDGSWEAVKFETGEPPKYFVYATSDGFESEGFCEAASGARAAGSAGGVAET